MKILHLPTTTGGNAWGLSQAERALGYHSDVLIADKNPLKYQADIIIKNNLFHNNKYIDKFFLEVKKIISFFQIRNKYDIYHFNFGSSLLSYPLPSLYLLDLPYYNRRAKIIVTYNGCDARQKYATLKRTQYAACANNNCYNGICNDIKVEQARAQKISIFDKYANHIYSVNPDLLYFLPERAKFVPYTIANWTNTTPPSYQPRKKLKIVHSPTNRECKGSDHIIQAIQILNKKYSNYIDFTLVENMPYEKAQEVYRQADLVIDQLLIGYYGAFTVEVMKMGKPVMVYINEKDLKFLPTDMQDDCLDTIINVNAYNIIDKLANIIENPEQLTTYSEKSLTYANKWHNPEQIAKQVITDYES